MRLKKINSKVVALTTELLATGITSSTGGATTPIAPSITVAAVKDTSGNTNLLFRIFVFIDSDSTTPPDFSIDENKTTDFYVTFNLREKTPSKYTVWYIEAVYPVNHYGDATVYLLNQDPKTSRGTVVIVSTEVPNN